MLDFTYILSYNISVVNYILTFLKRRVFYAYHIDLCGSEQDAKAGILFRVPDSPCKKTAKFSKLYSSQPATGLKKDPVDRTSNENEVIETVRIGIEMANEKLQKDVDRLTKQLQSLPASDPARTKIQKRIENKQKNHPVMPTSDHWMLTYETLDAVMKNTKNSDYYAMPSQANQQVLRKVLKDWKSYFESLASYRQNPRKI